MRFQLNPFPSPLQEGNGGGGWGATKKHILSFLLSSLLFFRGNTGRRGRTITYCFPLLSSGPVTFPEERGRERSEDDQEVFLHRGLPSPPPLDEVGVEKRKGEQEAIIYMFPSPSLFPRKDGRGSGRINRMCPSTFLLFFSPPHPVKRGRAGEELVE